MEAMSNLKNKMARTFWRNLTSARISFIRKLAGGMALLALILSFSSCSIKEPEFREVKKLAIKKAGLKSSTLTMEVVMHNPNGFGVDLSRADLDLYIDDSFLGRTEQQYKVHIPKNSDFSVPVSLEVNTKTVLKNSLNVLLNEKVAFKAMGSIRLGKKGVYKTFKVDYSGMHSVPLDAVF